MRLPNSGTANIALSIVVDMEVSSCRLVWRGGEKVPPSPALNKENGIINEILLASGWGSCL